MKKVKFNGKLSLNKETIAKLNQDEINSVKGGATYPCIIVPVTTTLTIRITTTIPPTSDTTFINTGNFGGGMGGH